MNPIGFISITESELRNIVAGAVTDALELHNAAHQPGHPQPDELLTRQETAKLLHISLLTLRNYEKRNILKPRRIGRRVLFSRSDVLACLESSGGKGGAKPRKG